MAKKTQRIREAAYRYHLNGESFETLGRAFDVSGSTVHRWSQTQEWKDEIQDLDLLDRERLAREYSVNLERVRKRLEASGLSATEISIKMLLKLRELIEGLDTSELDDPRDRVTAIKAVSSSFSVLADVGKTLVYEGLSIDQLAELLGEKP